MCRLYRPSGTAQAVVWCEGKEDTKWISNEVRKIIIHPSKKVGKFIGGTILY
jgi:hypothetical protein